MYNLDYFLHYCNPDYGRVTHIHNVSPKTFEDEINKFGRRGHCYSSTWGGREHTFILVDYDSTTGMVSINENGTPSSVYYADMIGLTYIGVQCSAGGPGGGPGGGSKCRWVYVPILGWQWICHP